MTLCLSACLTDSLSACVPKQISICGSLTISLSICVSYRLSLSVGLQPSHSLSTSVSLSASLTYSLSAYVSNRIFVCGSLLFLGRYLEDIVTHFGPKIVFHASYDDKHTYKIKIVNSSARRIGWAIETTNMKRLGVDPASGVLDPKEATLMAVSYDAFADGQENINNDRITITWTNTSDGAAKLRRGWFQGDRI